jgi:hypothetical protein
MMFRISSRFFVAPWRVEEESAMDPDMEQRAFSLEISGTMNGNAERRDAK